MSQLQTTTNIPTLKRTQDINEVVSYVSNLANIVARMSKELDHVVNGNISSKNLKSNSIDAKALGIAELSDITDKLGKMFSGELYNPKILSRQVGYPRLHWSDTGDTLSIEFSADKRIELDPHGTLAEQFPAIKFITDAYVAKLNFKGATGAVLDADLTVNNIKVASQSNIRIGATNLQTILSAITGDITSLENNVSTLQSDVSTLLSNVSTINSQITSIEGEIATILTRLDNIEAQL